MERGRRTDDAPESSPGEAPARFIAKNATGLVLNLDISEQSPFKWQDAPNGESTAFSFPPADAGGSREQLKRFL
jgi:hypothetical protein